MRDLIKELESGPWPTLISDLKRSVAMKKFLEDISKNKQKIKDTEADIVQLEKQLIAAHHHLKIGDTVETNYWSAKEMVVDELTVIIYGNSVFFGANGNCVKKNGEIGKQRASTSKRIDL